MSRSLDDQQATNENVPVSALLSLGSERGGGITVTFLIFGLLAMPAAREDILVWIVRCRCAKVLVRAFRFCTCGRHL